MKIQAFRALFLVFFLLVPLQSALLQTEEVAILVVDIFDRNPGSLVPDSEALCALSVNGQDGYLIDGGVESHGYALAQPH